MGLVKIRFEVANEVQLSRAFETGIYKFNNLEKPFGIMADDFFRTMAAVFVSEGAYEGGNRWKALSPAYARWKARYFPGRKILELNGRMKDSLTIKGNSDNVLEINPDSLVVGTRVPYAIYHQTGTPKMPMRKIIELTNEQKLRWVHIMHAYIRDITESIAKTSLGGAQ
jgi:phage gpG-like protein